MAKDDKYKEIAKIIGTKIKQLRMAKGLTQEQLSENLGIDNKQLSRIETGCSLPNIILAKQVSNFFNFNLLDLIDSPIDDKTQILDNVQFQSFSILNSAINKLEKTCYLEALKHTQKCLKLGKSE